MTTEAKFKAQLAGMKANAAAWRAAHPDQAAVIQFNFPRAVLVICPISQALKRKIITTNPPGLELVKALWPWDQSEPSVMMVRSVLEDSPHPLAAALPHFGTARLLALQTADGFWHVRADQAQVGKVYEVDLSSIRTGTFTNEPTGQTFQCQVIDVWDDSAQNYIHFPLELLEIQKD